MSTQTGHLRGDVIRHEGNEFTLKLPGGAEVACRFKDRCAYSGFNNNLPTPYPCHADVEVETDEDGHRRVWVTKVVSKATADRWDGWATEARQKLCGKGIEFHAQAVYYYLNTHHMRGIEMPIRVLDERQHALPFEPQYIEIVHSILRPARIRRQLAATKITYQAPIPAPPKNDMLADGYQVRGDKYLDLTKKLMKFTRRLMKEAHTTFDSMAYVDFDMDFEELHDEFEECLEYYDRELSRSHAEQKRELAKIRLRKKGH